MPERGPAQLQADLRFEVSTATGSTTARLHSTDAGLVLDVADPGRMLSALPSRRLTDKLPGQAVADLLGSVAVSVRTDEKELMRLRFTDRRRLRIRLRPAGVLLAVRLYIKRVQPEWAVAAGLGAVGVVVLRGVRGRRRARELPA